MAYVEALIEKRLAVLAELDEIRSQIAGLTGRVAAKEAQLRNLDDLLALEEPAKVSAQGTGLVAQAVSPARSQRFTDIAVEVLSERGQPTHYQELARLMLDRGAYIPGKDPAANLIAHMLRDARFARSQGRGMYGLAGWASASRVAKRTAGHVRMDKSAVRVRRDGRSAR